MKSSFSLIFCCTLASCAAASARGQGFNLDPPPKAATSSTVDDYFGTQVADPYRQLEDSGLHETQAWIAAQTRRSEAYLSKLPGSRSLADKLTKLKAHPSMSTPQMIGGRTYFSYNAGDAPFATVYTGDPSDASSWRPLIDVANIDPTLRTTLSGFAPSPCGHYLAYALSESGEDLQHWRIIRMADLTRLDDALEPTKFTDLEWDVDDGGFFYSRLATAAQGRHKDQPNAQSQVYFHRLGTLQDDDVCVFAHADVRYDAEAKLSPDGHILAILTAKGSERQHGLYVRDRRVPQAAFRQVLAESRASVGWVGVDGNRVLLMTTLDAPKGRLVALDTQALHPAFETVIAEGDDTLRDVHIAGDVLLVSFIRHTASVIKPYNLQGRALGDALPLPDLVWTTGLAGDRDAEKIYVSVFNNTMPPAIYALTRGAKGFSANLAFKTDVGENLDAFVTKRIFAKSADGTQVPIILSHRKDLPRDGQAPTRMYGYGGFTLPVYPAFHEADLLWMQQGGIVVRTAARGGGEYGERWHEAGSGLNKQNTFDDFVAAAKHLIACGYTSPPKLAIEGHSNGGLLVAASELQHPQLFAAVHCDVGVLDMLRFAQFTAGRGWITEYGDVTQPDGFAALYRYSPVHHAVRGTRYPATLIVTGDHDDRVVPMHSLKFAAALQEAQGGDAPILLKVDRDVGHGGPAARAQTIAKEVEMLTFFAHALGMPL